MDDIISVLKKIFTVQLDGNYEEGFKTLGFSHIVCLLIICVLVTAACAAFRRMGAHGKILLLRVISILLIITEIIQDLIFIFVAHTTILYNLPLHLCGLGLFVNLIIAFGIGRNGNGKIKAFILKVLEETDIVLILPGAVCALITPDWTYLPIYNWQCIQGFFSHCLLVMFSSLLLFGGIYLPSFRHWYYPLVFLGSVSPLIYIFDKVFGCDYMFLLQPVYGTVLEYLEKVHGKDWYTFVFAVFVIIVILLIYLFLFLFHVIYGKIHKSKAE